MPLSFPDLPSDITGFLNDHLSKLAAHYGQSKPEHPVGLVFDPQETEMPHEVLALSLMDLRRGADVSNAAREGWRLFLREAPPVRVAEVHRDADDASLLFLGITAGPQVDYARRLLEQLNSDQTDGVAYTVRLLRVKPLYLDCVWLSAESPQETRTFRCHRRFRRSLSVAATGLRN